MKRLIVTLIFLLILLIPGFNQLVFEGKYNDKYKRVHLDNGDIKLIAYDKKAQALYINNLDQSPWKKVIVKLPSEHLLDEIKSITQNTFNPDTLIELVYSCVEYKRVKDSYDPEKSTLQIQFTLNIINENGETILKVPDSNEMEIIDGEETRKLLIYRHIGTGMDTEGHTLVYTIPKYN